MALVSVNWSPAARQLRQFGLLAAAVALIVAVWLYDRHGWTPYVWCLGVIGLGVAAAGLLWPESLRSVFIGVMIVTFPIGWAVSYLILVVIYFGMFTAVALVFRLIGRDALQRRLAPEAATYWQPKRQVTDVRQYLRQY